MTHFECVPKCKRFTATVWRRVLELEIIELEIIELLKHLRSVVPNSLNFHKLVLPDVNESEQNWVGIAVV